MLAMANRAYLSVWSKDFAEATMLDQLVQLLGTVPFSAGRPAFTELVIRAVDPAQTALMELDLQGLPVDVPELVRLARDHLYDDSAYQVGTHWDLWVYDLSQGRWQLRPQRLEITCHGEAYENGVCAERGHFLADIGLEHMFTGHAGLPNSRAASVSAPQHPAEEEFLAVMARPEKLREYYQKTRENIQKLLDWIQALERSVPLKRSWLWSEGEENFEARLDEILAAR